MGDAIRGIAVAGVALAGCTDVVIGQFSGTEGGGTGGGSVLVDASTSTGSTAVPEASGFQPTTDDTGSDTTGGPPDVDPWQSGCFGDDFEDASIDPDMWNFWTDGDSFAEEAEGLFRFTPPTSGVLDTGLITNYLHFVNFDNGTMRVQVPAPPDPARPVILFVSIQESWLNTVVSFKLNEGTATISGRNDAGETFDDPLPGVSNPPWVGLRAEGDLIHFETSLDGIDWVTEATRDKPSPLAYAQPFFMVQTYGKYPDPVAVSLDNFEVCLD